MNTFGNRLKITIFGASHSPEMGVVVDGVPAGVGISGTDFTGDIARRAPSAPGTTERRESDIPHICSGVCGGVSTGAPVCIKFFNEDTRSGDYAQFADIPRPGHADYAASIRYGGMNDARGGGQFSGRMTLPLVAAGVLAKKLIPGIECRARLVEVGGSKDPSCWDGLVAEAAGAGDSLGGVVECVISGVPVGFGEPFFDSVESMLSHAVFSIPGVRGIEFGDGFAAAAMRGSRHNDPFTENGPAKNGAGGVNGGLSNGAPIVFRVAFKPASSISMPQETYNFAARRMDTLHIGGRHDVCFALRTPVIVEAVAAIVMADLAMS